MSSNGMSVLVGGAWDEHQRNIDDTINRAYGLPMAGNAPGALLYQPFAPDAAVNPAAPSVPSGAAAQQPGGSWYNFAASNPANMPSTALSASVTDPLPGPLLASAANNAGGNGAMPNMNAAVPANPAQAPSVDRDFLSGQEGGQRLHAYLPDLLKRFAPQTAI